MAYPAERGIPGGTTFIVNHEGFVYQKDFGDETMGKAKSTGNMTTCFK